MTFAAIALSVAIITVSWCRHRPDASAVNLAVVAALLCIFVFGGEGGAAAPLRDCEAAVPPPTAPTQPEGANSDGGGSKVGKVSWGKCLREGGGALFWAGITGGRRSRRRASYYDNHYSNGYRGYDDQYSTAYGEYDYDDLSDGYHSGRYRKEGVLDRCMNACSRAIRQS